MKKLFLIIIVIYLSAAGFLYVRSANNPCNNVLTYSIGSYDPRFGITLDQFTKMVKETEVVWEQPADRDLFTYDPNAEFKINLVFDDRQQKTIDQRNLKQTIDLSEDSYETLVEQYNSLSFQHQQNLAAYNQAKAQYEDNLREYNSQVAYWNARGGAPADEYKKLQVQKQALQAQANELERTRIAVNAQANTLNSLAERVNEVARKLNRDVDLFNGKFGQARQFDQGSYTGAAINIYQFNEAADLRLVLAHEFGHALHIEHVEEPTAIMYYLMDQQDVADVHLTNADLNALKQQCQAL